MSAASEGSGNVDSDGDPDVPPRVMEVLRQAMRKAIFNVCLSGGMDRNSRGSIPRSATHSHSQGHALQFESRHWPTKATQKQSLGVGHHQHSDLDRDQSSEMESEDTEEGEFLSDEETERILAYQILQLDFLSQSTPSSFCPKHCQS